MIVSCIRSMAVGLLAVLLLVGGATSARAQSESPLEDARLESVRERLERSLEAARSEGLPAELLRDKVREGLAKRVPAPRIAAAVRTVLGHLRSADHMVARVPAHERVKKGRLVRAAAEALMAGVDEDGLDRLVSTLTDSAGKGAAPVVEEGLIVVAELAERGIDGQLAASSARRAYENRGRDGWTALLRAVRSLGRASPAERARAVRRAAEAPRGGAPGLEGHPHGGPKGHSKGKGR